MKQYVFILILSCISISTLYSQEKIGLIVYYNIEGVQNTDLNPHYSTPYIEEVVNEFYYETANMLKEKYALKDINLYDYHNIVRKNGLNRLKSIKKLKSKERHAPGDILFKVKVDIAFDENVGVSLLLNQDTKRATMYLTIAVFEKGENVDLIKLKIKDVHTYIGEDTPEYLGMNGYVWMYNQILDELAAYPVTKF